MIKKLIYRASPFLNKNYLLLPGLIILHLPTLKMRKSVPDS